MRSDQEMLELIVGTARKDARIRAVILTGSRTDPDALQDPFQDFDVIYLVTDVAPFWGNREWIRRFGELMIVQTPEDMEDPPPRGDGNFTFLMQFADGNRIDLGVYPLEMIDEVLKECPSTLLLDKDGRIDALPPASEADYLPQPPSAKAFADCCNEFWWVCPYVAKGLWRREISYAKYHLDYFIRNQLMKMIDWHIGQRTGFSQNPGKYGKYYERYLESELWEMFQGTYSDADVENTWDALEAMCDLFRTLAVQVAERFDLSYPYGEDERVSAHLEHVRDLPPSAKEIYNSPAFTR